jgi:non-ribosomal peptide synthetase-like protein
MYDAYQARLRAATPRSASREGLLHRLFELQAELRPRATAVEHGSTRLSYAELERRANQLAHHLRELGVGPGTCAALLLHPSADAVIALLAVLKAGAAYVPLDPNCPVERLRFVLRDCGAVVVLTQAALAPRLEHCSVRRLALDGEHAAIARRSTARVGAPQPRPQDLCYVIYTSGSTGQPKGVMVEHRNVRHLVEAERKVYGVEPRDRVYHGASLSFDLSVEELWLALANGATLVIADGDGARPGPDLARFLAAQRVTVLSGVPTLLSMLGEEKLPALRLLILGGEACPDELVARWARRGRRIVNTYGPTEATVIATYAEVVPGRPVTIGRPVPGYRVHLLDERLREVPPGQAGEICIGGRGVARGYLGLPERSRERFVPDPFAPADEPEARLYRSGDLACLDERGELRFLGRNDAQVKLRGFRIELTEIEAVLLADPAVAAAGCAVHPGATGAATLVGYVVPKPGAAIDEAALRARLRTKLPVYMVPALIERVTELPRLASGKLDRAALPAPQARPEARRPDERRRTPDEARIAAVWEKIFDPQPVALGDDFFLDLGGHSLLAAQLVSELRRDPRYAAVSVRDVYEHPTVAKLAAALETLAPEPAPAHHARDVLSDAVSEVIDEEERDELQRRHLRAGLVQTGGLYFLYAFHALQWITPYLVYFALAGEVSTLAAIGWAALCGIAVLPTLLALAVATKWLLLGRIRAGRHPLWGAYHLRWWFAQGLIEALHLNRFVGTPLLPWVFRLLGARIGRDVHLETDSLAAFDLIEIGDGSTLDEKAGVFGAAVEGDALVIGPVRIGRDCFVGTDAVLREDTQLGDGARLEDLSLLPRGGRIPRGQTWSGSPAQHQPAATLPPERAPQASESTRLATTLGYAALALVLPLLPLLAFIPGVALLSQIDPLEETLHYLAVAPLVGGSFVLLLTFGTVALKWLLVGRIAPCRYPVHSGRYIRKWIVDRLLHLSLDVAGSLHATLYLPHWYRALGARIGRWVELSTATGATPDLLTMDDGATVADEVSLGAPRIERGWVTLAPTRVGKRAFVGNGGILRQGQALGDGALVGVLSISPEQSADAARADAAWLGSPPISLPRRQQSATFPVRNTYEPTPGLVAARATVELLRITLPPAGFILVTTTVVTGVLMLWESHGLLAALALLPLIYMACCAALALGVAAAKWLIVGRYAAFERPLWSPFVWRLEFVNALYEFLLTPLVLEPLHGTPWLPAYLRLLGARIGRCAYLHTTGFVEWDLVDIGERVAIGDDAVLQTHLFEDRVLKAAPLRIGDRCTIGAGSVVLYGATMHDGAELDALSLLMKGESLPAGTRWEGSPARKTRSHMRRVDDGRHHAAPDLVAELST